MPIEMTISWIPVEDGLPPSLKRVLFYAFNDVMTGYRNDEGDWFDEEGFLGNGIATHWAEIPKVPKCD